MGLLRFVERSDWISIKVTDANVSLFSDQRQPSKDDKNPDTRGKKNAPAKAKNQFTPLAARFFAKK